MAEKPVAKQNAALAGTIGVKLDVPGDDLDAVTKRAGRLLPRRLRHEAAYLVQAEEMAAHPKLRHLVDRDRMARSERKLRAYVRTRDPEKERTDRRLGWIASLAFNILLYGVLLVAFLYWRGLIGPGQ